MGGNEEDTVTMEDLLNQQALLEEEANAKILENWGDENVCTFDKGYFKQPVYACLTCSAKTKKQFGFCFGCSMNCHVAHDVVEIFDKRHFRCDCGTPNSGCQCGLSPSTDRSENNAENKYSHNFDGKYCVCNKGYDPDMDVMLQCVVCQDWFHEDCLESHTTVPVHTTFKDFVCQGCSNYCNFLPHYAQYRVGSQGVVNSTNATSSIPLENLKPTTTADHTEGLAAACKCSSNPNAPSFGVDTFWKSGWRKQLCACSVCRQLYCHLSVLFLIEEPEDEDDEEDSAYVEGDSGSATTTTTTTTTSQAPTPAMVLVESTKRPYMSILENSAEKAFLQNPGMNHESKLNIINGYNEMSDKLKVYLETFAKSGKTVTKADVESFFAELRTKRRRTSLDDT